MPIRPSIFADSSRSHAQEAAAVLSVSKLAFKIVCGFAITAGALQWSSIASAAPLKKNPRHVSAPVAAEITIVPVKEHVYLLASDHGNVTARIGTDGIFVVDTLDAATAPKVIEALHTLSKLPVLYIVNTHAHPASTGGNKAFVDVTGGTGPIGARFGRGMDTAKDSATIISHENVSLQLSQEKTIPEDAWPSATYFYGEKEVYFDNEGVRMIYMPAAHTNGDTVVYFRGSDVISTGEIFNTTGYPIIDHAAGGTVAGVIAALNRILDIAIPKHHQEGGTMIIPGRGRLCDEHEVLEYRDMLVIIRARVKDLIDKGMTLEQIKKRRPSLDYDRRYDAGWGDWSADDLVSAMFEELRAQQ